MADEKIEVEWIATANKMVQVLDRLEAKFDKQEKALQKMTETGRKGADAAAGSFNKLEEELKQSEAALKKLTIGTTEFDKQRKKVDELRKSLTEAKGKLSEAGTGLSGLMQTGVGKIAALGAGMVSFQAVVSAVVDELEKVKTLKLDAAAQTRTFEQAIADVGQNIGAEAMPEARRMILDQAPKLGVTTEGLANILGIAISAGAKDLKEAMSLSAAALKLTVGDAAKAQALVGGTLDVASLGGSQNFEGALGQLLQTQSQVRSTNLSEFAANIGPGLAAATADASHQKGVTTERALETASVISQIIKDQTGSNTATTMRMLFTRMGSFVPEREKKMDDGGVARVTREQIAAFSKLDTFDARLKMMSEVPAIGQQFLETQRESIGKTAIAEIINRSGRAVQFEEKAKANIDSIDAAQGFFTKLYEETQKQTPILTAERKAQQNIAVAEITGGRAGAGQVQKIVDDTIAKVNLSGFDAETSGAIRNRMRIGAAVGESPTQSGIAALREAQSQRSAFGILPIGGQVSDSDRALIERQIQALEQLAKQLEGQQPRPVRPGQVPVARPKEAPLPAATQP
jgi:hypothetical protein